MAPNTENKILFILSLALLFIPLSLSYSSKDNKLLCWDTANFTEKGKGGFNNPILLQNYINGFKKPSKAREQEIMDFVHKLGKELVVA